MVAQTQVNPTGGASSPSQAVAHNTSELLADAVTLAELQGKLLAIDVEDGLRKLLTPLVLLVAGAVLALSCLPIVLVTMALGLVAGWDLAPWLAFLIAAAIGALLATALLATGLLLVRYRFTFLARSRLEWQQNVTWFKSVVRRLGKSSSRPPAPGW